MGHYDIDQTCPECGAIWALLDFEIGSKHLVCPVCHTRFELETIRIVDGAIEVKVKAGEPSGLEKQVLDSVEDIQNRIISELKVKPTPEPHDQVLAQAYFEIEGEVAFAGRALFKGGPVTVHAGELLQCDLTFEKNPDNQLILILADNPRVIKDPETESNERDEKND